MPGSFTDFAETKILDHWFGGSTWGVPNPLHLGYFLTASSENGPGAEPNGNGYNRTPVPPEMWLTSVAQLTQNIQDIICPRSTGEQGDVVGIGLFDSSVGGNCIVNYPADSPLLIQKADSLVVLSGALVHQWNSGGFTNFLKNKILNHVYKSIPMGVEPTLWAALCAGCTDATAGTEVSGGGYVRYAMANNGSNFASTSGGIKKSVATIQYPKSTGSWGSPSNLAFFNSQSGGQFLAYGPLDPAPSIAVDQQLSILAGDVEITLD